MENSHYKYAFGDESGDLGFAFGGGSSHYFVISLVLTSKPEEIRQEIENLRRKLGHPNRIEFRFSKLSDRYRYEFLQLLARSQFEAYSLVIDKQKVLNQWAGKKDFEMYAEAFLQLVTNIPPHHFNHTKLFLDQFGSIKRTRLAIRQKLKNLPNQPFQSPKMSRSQGNDLIQCADMVAGSVRRYWEQNDDRFVQIIHKKLTVQTYP